jgi:hypothetical protein
MPGGSIIIGLAAGAMAVVPIHAPSPAHAQLVPPQPCSTVSNALPPTSSCTIADGELNYEISIVINSFVNAFSNPSAEMFWWGDSDKARDAAAAVGLAFGFPNDFGTFGEVGPYFASGISNPSSGGEVRGGVCFGSTLSLCFGGVPLEGCLDPFLCGPPTEFEVENVWARSSLVRTPDQPAVPSPLPAIGAAAAYGYSRKLRKRIKSQGLLKVS